MAERRMFSKTIIDSDLFLDMPLSAQALYFHLSMRADDDGFLNNAQKIIRMTNATKNDYDLLLLKRFIIRFEDGICVIKHWRIHNYIRSDRYKPTIYQDKIKRLSIEENKSYVLSEENTNAGIPDGYQMDTQVSIEKDKLDKTRTGEERVIKDSLLNSEENKNILSEPDQKVFDEDKIKSAENKVIKLDKYTSEENSDKSNIGERSSRNSGIEERVTDEQLNKIVKMWNSMKISRIATIKNKRLKLVSERIKENGIETFFKAIEKVNNSDFLKGENKRDWIISFDWFIKADNFIKVLKGRYDNNTFPYEEEIEQSSFNNFISREYDYNSLEKKLLGWDKD